MEKVMGGRGQREDGKRKQTRMRVNPKQHIYVDLRGERGVMRDG